MGKVFTNPVDIKHRVQRKKEEDLTMEERDYIEDRQGQRTVIQDKKPRDEEEIKGLVWARSRETVWRQVQFKEAGNVKEQRANKRKRYQRQTFEIDSSEEERIPMMSAERNTVNPRKKFGEKIASFWVDSGHTGAMIGNG